MLLFVLNVGYFVMSYMGSWGYSVALVDCFPSEAEIPRIHENETLILLDPVLNYASCSAYASCSQLLML